MMTFDEVADVLEDIIDGLPQELFEKLNGGVNLLPDIKTHTESSGHYPLFIMGEYHHHGMGLGRFINIYYGSFVRLFGYRQREHQISEIRRVLLHELTHHLESLAGVRDLEIQDAIDLEKYRETGLEMAAFKTDGNCYICGRTLGKTAMKNHLLREHSYGDEECLLLKIEGAHAKEYWLMVDIAKHMTLGDLDAFLRKIWLDCCGHLSKFKGGTKSRKLSAFAVGNKLAYEYDIGAATEFLITVVGETRRRPQDAVRLLARNLPPVFYCETCGAHATLICIECSYDHDNPCFCELCAKAHAHGEWLPITNSPRCGECCYDGELDTFAYSPPTLL